MRDVEIMRDALRADTHHDRECCATANGKRAFDLRQQAHAAAQQGYLQDAVELLQQAIALLPLDVDTVGLAAARHDLANALINSRNHPGAIHRVSELLEQAVASEARRRYPRRWAVSVSLLGSRLRTQAAHETDAARTASLLDRAEALLREAVDVAEAARSWDDAVGHWFNLGNLLRERGDATGAIDAYERSLECSRPYEKSPEFLAKRELPALLVNLGQMLRSRGRSGDTKRSRTLLERAIKVDHAESVIARIALAEWYLEDGNVERAARWLRGVDFAHLGMDRLDAAVRLLERAGLATEARMRLRHLIDQLFAERSGAVADVRADVLAVQLQRCAAVLAGALLRNHDIVDAFLILDNTSGLRFAEATNQYAARLRDPLSRGLWHRFTTSGTTAARLEDAIDRLQLVPRACWRELIVDWLRGLEELEGEASAIFAGTVAALREAVDDDLLNLEPIVRARDLASEQAGFARLALAAREPAHSLTDGPFQADLGQTELQTLLEPGSVFLRFTLDASGRLLVISVSLDGGELVARHAALLVPRTLFCLLAEYTDGGERARISASLAEALAGLDLSSVLGDGRQRRAVVLPSSAVARLPLAGLGPPGARLIDRFEEITWLPNLLPLRSRQDSHRPRRGVLTVAPGERGNTKWHDLAVRRDLADERRLVRRGATVEQVLTYATTADIVSFYAHGSYVDGGTVPKGDGVWGPAIALADGEKLTLSSLTDQWEGVERVELWCCKSGVNMPMDPMGVAVDEAFGFDYEFLRVGARSAIGTLYEVSEIPTAVIADHFRGRVIAGVAAPAALADAQRHWIAQALPELIGFLHEDPGEGLARFAAARGVVLPSRGRVEASAFEALLRSPLAWAAFRFVGVAERRPLAAWDKSWERPLTDDETAAVDALIEDVRSRSPPAAEPADR